MSKRQIIMILGVWVMILFIPNFPESYKTFIGLATGVLIIFVASRIKPDISAKANTSETFVESKKEVAAQPVKIAPAPEPKADPVINNPEEKKIS